MRRVYAGPLGGLAGFACGLVYASATPPEYVSDAVVRRVSSVIPERFIPGADSGFGVDPVPGITQTVLARHTLANIVQTHDLYGAERKSLPVERIVELMRRSISFESQPPDRIRIAFRYKDPEAAQKAVRELMTRLIDESLRYQLQQTRLTREFLEGLANKAADQLTPLPAAASERQRIDHDIARREYESLKTKVHEARLLESLAGRRQGPIWEVLDVPSLPSNPETAEWQPAGVGAAAGLVLGLLALLVPWRMFRRPAQIVEA
ncbi:MAG: hypothetical protein FJW39_20620 [Acidobacteria bacterium]|nr:hypothetical protein [Acidobacteriota bacterium]